MSMRNWLLPECIEDVLPAEAARIEQLRRRLLDLFHVHGYQYVIPPMLEYMESLITGAGHDLDLATFKVVDRLTGRLMGVRADMTPQASRIDAHLLNNQGVTRLCYAGSVLRTQADGLAHTREPLQIGAELYGHAGAEGDIEIQGLMIQALQAVGLSELYIDFNHVGIFDSLVSKAQIGESLEQALYKALQSKDKSAVVQLSQNLDATIKTALLSLTDLNGDAAILDKAEKCLPATAEIKKALHDLRMVGQSLANSGVHVCYDLSELRGYHYHSGMVFAAYAAGYSGPLALGGRYDEVGVAFGRSRPATGFSLDLRGVVTALPLATIAPAIFAPFVLNDAALATKIASLRAQGHVVIQALPGHESYRSELNCNRQLIFRENSWQVIDFN